MIQIYLQDTRTGKVVCHYQDTGTFKTWADAWFYWTEGNFGCDCNRSIAMGCEEEDELDCNPNDNVIEIIAVIDSCGQIHIEDLEGY